MPDLARLASTRNVFGTRAALRPWMVIVPRGMDATGAESRSNSWRSATGGLASLYLSTGLLGCTGSFPGLRRAFSRPQAWGRVPETPRGYLASIIQLFDCPERIRPP